MKVMFVYPGFENIGIEYLSAVLKQHGHQTRLAFDPRIFGDQFIPFKSLGNLFNYETKILRDIVEYSPDLVAFSVVSSDYEWALRLSRRLKLSLDAPVVFGGIHPSALPGEVLKNDCVDFVVSGEGEYALLDLVNSLRKKDFDRSISNLSFRDGNKIVMNPLRGYISDLCSVPYPDKSLFYDCLPGYARHYTIITRRGCRNNCSYCHNTVWNALYPTSSGSIRLRSVEDVIKELELGKNKYKYEFVRFNDDLFTSDENWLKEFSVQYKSKIGAPFICFVSPGTTNAKIVQYLKEAGCTQVCMGVQTINEELKREVLNRYETKEEVALAISLYRRFKIRCVADNIIGLPGETEKHILETVNFYLENPVYGRIAIFWLIYFPGTLIVHKAIEMGALSKDEAAVLESEPGDTANTLPGKLHSKKLIRYHLLFLFLQFFPRRISNFVITKGIYKYFPPINPAIIEIPFTMFTKDRLDPMRRRYFGQYLQFIPEIIKEKLRNIPIIKTVNGKKVSRLSLGISCARTKLLRQRIPLMVTWHLTHRCNYDCVYCGISSNVSRQELGTEDTLALIDELGRSGTKRIHFCGGEPLLREDLAQIVDYCNRKSIEVGLISNGSLVPQSIGYLKKISLLKLSIDGPQDIHDRLRGDGSYLRLMNAADSALKEGINVVFNCTLTAINLNSVRFIIEIGSRMGIPVKFSPVNYVHSGDKDISQLIPDRILYKKALEEISREAKKYRNVLNSSCSLEYLKLYPEGKSIQDCAAGRIYCHIRPDGSVHLCERMISDSASRYSKGDFLKRFLELGSHPAKCKACWCTGVLELNFAYGLRISAILNALRMQ